MTDDIQFYVFEKLGQTSLGNMYLSTFAFKNSGISCMASMFDLSNPKMKIQHVKNRFKVAKYDRSVQFDSWLRQVALSWSTWIRSPQGFETSLDPRQFCVGYMRAAGSWPGAWEVITATV